MIRIATVVYPISSYYYFLTNFITAILLVLVAFELPAQILSTEIKISSYPCEIDFHERCVSSELHCLYLQLDTNVIANQLFSDERAVKLFAEADGNVSVSRLDINFVTITTPQKEGTRQMYTFINILYNNILLLSDVDMIGRFVDRFLTPRPWWRVVEEPFWWQFHSDGDSREESVPPAKLSVSFVRRPAIWDGHLKLLASVQFPPAQTCSRSSM